MGDTPDAWELVSERRYAEAAEAYTSMMAAGHGTFAQRGRASALLLAGRLAEALADFRQVIAATDPKHRSDGDYLRLGTCHWHLAQSAEAVSCWREALAAPYTDAAGGVVREVFLLYAGVRLRDSQLAKDAIGLLRKRRQKHLRRVRRGSAKTAMQAHEDFVHPGLFTWPGAVVPFLLGEMGTAELDAAVTQTNTELRERYQCQADFAVAVRALRDGDEGSFRDRMARSAEAVTHGPLEDEFYQARWEEAHQYRVPAF